MPSLASDLKNQAVGETKLRLVPIMLERNWDAAVAAAGEEVARTWRLYMSGARVGFERGDLDVAQLLLARPLADGARPERPLRPWWRCRHSGSP